MAELFREDYQDKFSPLAYLDSRYRTLEKDWIPFQLDNGFSLLRHEAVSGSRLLDLGCGPNLVNIIAAPNHFTHIVMADYSEANVDFTRRWSRGDDVNYDWDHVCKYYKEKYDLDQSWEKTRLTELKSSIKDVTLCDVMQSEPLGPSYTGYFDCIYSSYCLETASRNLKDCNQSVQNVSTLLRDGGHLIMRSVLEGKCYPVGDSNFFTFPLSAPQLKISLKKAGLKVIELIIEDTDKSNTGYCLLAQRVEDTQAS